HDFRNSCQVWPFVVPAALAASHSEPHSFMMLSALAALEPAIAIPSAITAAAPTRRTDKRICNPSQRRKGDERLLARGNHRRQLSQHATEDRDPEAGL